MSEGRAPDMRPEITLDPDDWDEFRAFMHKVVDDTVDDLAGLRDLPVWQRMPDDVRERLHGGPPMEGAGWEGAWRDFVELVRPYPVGNRHPRFWGWVNGQGTPMGMVADFAAAALNANCGGFDQAPAEAERQTLSWFRGLMGLPESGGGIFLSGGSEANLVGLLVARHFMAGNDVRAEGLDQSESKLCFYSSTETHFSNQRALEVMGVGAQQLRKIPVDSEFRMDIEALASAIQADRDAGDHPACVIAHVGTVNTGAIDDVDAIADLCASEGLWLHVDGAFGALLALSEALRPQVAAMSRADSIAFDLHKWMFMPYDCAVTLFRDDAQQEAAFKYQADYLIREPDTIMDTPVFYSHRGIQLSRGFKALKAWMSIKADGLDTFARLIEQNIEQAAYLGALADESPELERLAPVSLNIVNFRYRPEGVDEDELDELNAQILKAIQASGVAVPSSTFVNGKYAIRVAITNHRTRREDLDMLVLAVVEQGRSLL